MSLRWEDERYVRVYTRDTVDWLTLSWEARALFVLILRKVDRAGILDVGRAGRRGVAVATGVPVEVAARAVDELLQDGCIEEHGTTFVVRNFIEAQEAPSSGAQRSRESRAKARDVARANPLNSGKAATKRVATDTPCNDATRGDTPFCSDPCLETSSAPARVIGAPQVAAAMAKDGVLVPDATLVREIAEKLTAYAETAEVEKPEELPAVAWAAFKRVTETWNVATAHRTPLLFLKHWEAVQAVMGGQELPDRRGNERRANGRAGPNRETQDAITEMNRRIREAEEAPCRR